MWQRARKLVGKCGFGKKKAWKKQEEQGMGVLQSNGGAQYAPGANEAKLGKWDRSGREAAFTTRFSRYKALVPPPVACLAGSFVGET